MDGVARHYETLLAEHYSWMFGVPFEAKTAKERKTLEDCGVARCPKGVAVDLGCSPGFQSVALAGMGFERIIAIDTSEVLLEELSANKGNFPIQAVRADLREFRSLLGPELAGTIVCMGDTLTHLQNRHDVSKLLEDVRAALAPEGVFVITFRDLSVDLSGTDRILPVRAERDRIMLCVLDYEPETVVVNDVTYLRRDEKWSLHKSWYRKLRLSSSEVASELRVLGFTIERDELSGPMHAIAARKPAG